MVECSDPHLICNGCDDKVYEMVVGHTTTVTALLLLAVLDEVRNRICT
jgi:hypothetical protein